MGALGDVGEVPVIPGDALPVSGAFKSVLPGLTAAGCTEDEGGAVLVAAAGLPSMAGVIGSGETEMLPPRSNVPPGEAVVELPGDLPGVESTGVDDGCIFTGVASWSVVESMPALGISQVRLRT